MKTLFIAILIVVVFAAFFAVIRLSRCGLNTIRSCVKRFFKVAIYLSVFLCAVLVCMLSCYTQLSGFLKGVLSVSSVENLKDFLKMLSGADSTIVALQTLTMTSAVISFLSCVAFVFGGFVFMLIGNVYAGERVQDKVEESEVNCYGCMLPKTFLVYSRYNS